MSGLVSHAHDSFQKQGVEEEATISFRSKVGLSLKSCFELLDALRLLLNLASMKPVFPVRIEAFKNDHGQQIGDRWIPQRIEIWASHLREARTEIPFAENWIFQFADVRPRFADFMREWLDYLGRFSEALGCYSATVYHPLPEPLVW